jgi:putative membrane protein insertion efficiency factor
MGHRHSTAPLGGASAVCLTGEGIGGAHSLTHRLGELSLRALLAAIALYQVTLGPLLGGACKFHPSCSNYAREAVARYGWRGARLALGRLGRCRPFTHGGWDPVPDLDEE